MENSFNKKVLDYDVDLYRHNEYYHLSNYLSTSFSTDSMLEAQIEFHKKLNDVSNYISTLNIMLINGFLDGRDVSKKNEWRITGPVIDKFSKWVALPQSTKSRENGDFYIRTKFGYFPVNVKLIEHGSTVYNNICGIVYTASMLMFGKACRSKISLAKMMVTKDFTNKPQNYGIIAVDKKTCEAKWTTLYNFEHGSLYINPTNGWQFSMDSLKRVSRTQREGQKFIYKSVKEFFTIQAKAYNILKHG